MISIKNIATRVAKKISETKKRKKLAQYEGRLISKSKGDDQYKDYLRLQLHRTITKKKDHSSSKQEYLINLLQERVELTGLKVLCIGCRSIEEINYFKKAKAGNTVGIDLFSEDKEILVMDMHDMTFNNNCFDVIFSCHSLEHAQDYNRAISESIRVAKKEAIFVIEVPVNYETRGADIWDFKSIDHIKSLFQPYIKEILLEEYSTKGSDNNFAGTDVARVIFQIAK
ncbi:MAG: class I SAM-dependent methyltransferase [Candidatus Thorarchaeota archaeon]